MKTCSYCGKQYPDNAEVCDLDQHPLKLAVDSASLKEDKVEYTNADIIEIAKKQQMLLWAFFFSLIILRIQNTKILAVLIFAIFIYLLAKALRSPFSWLYAILAIIPLVGFITLAVINSKATEALKKRGIRVGLMGAKKEDLTKFYGPNPTP